ncbi:CheA signal transduction histidine kinase [Syntrophobacter sp. SbD2]|nr:CheA signal transduction histidine kinase [Syntrophobacter sp. SbD2]
MDRKDEDLLKKLLPMFKIEARDHLKIISSGLIELEKGGPEKHGEIIETIYRESHSLKGAARSVNRSDIVAICQALENTFSALKSEKVAPLPRILDLLHQAVDCASDLITGMEISRAEKFGVGEMIHKLEEAALQEQSVSVKEERTGTRPDSPAGEQEKPEEKTPEVDSIPNISTFIPETPPPAVPAPSSAETIRISTAKLDALLLKAEEMLAVKLAAGQLALELKILKNSFTRWKKERGKKESLKAALGRETPGKTRDEGEAGLFLTSFEAGLTNLIKAAEYDRRSIAAMVDSLLDDMKKTLMLPFSSFLESFPRFVRDLSRDAGKEVELNIEGGEIEIDRRILDEMKDPLIHLVRNCIDHGIEMPEDRKNKHKPAKGNIKVSVFSRDGRIDITVRDDGAGIDPAKVRAAAQKCGALSREEADRLGAYETLFLVFRSGVTTSPIITDISGRGLGLAIVKEKVEKLNGTISIDTQPDVGTSFSMVVPLTLATFRGVLVSVGGHLFVLPSTNVERVARVRKDEIQTVENRETLSLDGHVVSFVRLGAVLEFETPAGRVYDEGPYVQIAVLDSAGKRMAFLIDEVIQEQEILVKNLGPQLSRVRNIAGATLLGTGKVAPILNVHDLMISAVKVVPTPAGTIVAGPQKRLSILVVEDSITARTLLKTILESAGYEVTTAVDGIDAFTALKTTEFNLVVSDVEMPRMNGFDLTAKIRTDKNLSGLPVLVTALESHEDRERGIDAGANAYVVKSSFEQSNLLEVIRRLI